MTTSTANDNAEHAQWSFPDSAVCAEALHLVTAVSREVITNHCVRSYLFGREIGAARGLHAGADYDDETLFLACLLHDLGITDYGAGEQRFEIQGADAAAGFLRQHHAADDQVTTVWQTIALHSSLGLVNRFGTVQALAAAGISFDVDAVGIEAFQPEFLDKVNAAWPRLGLGHALAAEIARDAKAFIDNPMKAPPFTLPGHLNQLINGAPVIEWTDMVGASVWQDQPSGDTV